MIESTNESPTRPAEAGRSMPVRPALRIRLGETAGACTDCRLCSDACGFLKRCGTPGEIARRYDPSNPDDQSLPFECSLCRLCDAVCPAALEPSALFLEMRREAVERGGGSFAEHCGPLAYERRGRSRRLTWYGLPEGCRTVLFPGCSLPGTRPERARELFDALRGLVPSLGIVLDCCGRISHDLGREAEFAASFAEMRDWLLAQGVREVLVACPNCCDIFRQYGKALAVRTVYEVLPDRRAKACVAEALVHDPCGTRFRPEAHDGVRRLLAGVGVSPSDMEHARERTLCCGSGGGVDCLCPELAGRWSDVTASEIGGRTVVTSCAGCADRLGRRCRAVHVLDVLHDPEKALAGGSRVARAPLTYWNRYRLKERLRKELPVAASRERTPRLASGAKGWRLRVLFLLLLAGAVAALRMTGMESRLDGEALRAVIAGYGMLAPAAYMLIYALAPVLLLPGLPLTLAGGILFGPLWGVVYTITGATAGACLAFLAARHLAREWVEGKLRSPRWRRLDERVERHGWRIVAFTRLVPLFPFNLLNYAFGLTKIRFWPYALATFFGMLPACIAYVVFSSSLPDLFRGQVSIGLATGGGLVVLVSVAPFLYRRWRGGKGGQTPA